MNMQALMKQANKMKKEMEEKQKRLKSKEFLYENDFLSLKINGEKEIIDFSILKKDLESDDIEILEDMIAIAFKDVFNQVSEYTEEEFADYKDALGSMF